MGEEEGVKGEGKGKGKKGGRWSEGRGKGSEGERRGEEVDNDIPTKSVVFHYSLYKRGKSTYMYM